MSSDGGCTCSHLPSGCVTSLVARMLLLIGSLRCITLLNCCDLEKKKGEKSVVVYASADKHPPEYYLRQLHGGRRFYRGARHLWNNLKKECSGHKNPYTVVVDFVASCPVCQKYRLGLTDTLPPTYRHLKPAYSRKQIGADRLTATPADEQGNDNCIVLVEHFTKYASIYPAKDYTALSLANALFNHFSRFGVQRSKE